MSMVPVHRRDRLPHFSQLRFCGLVLGFVNAVVRPLLLLVTLVTLPFTLLTLGLFYFVVNGLAFSVASFFSAVLGALAVGAGVVDHRRAHRRAAPRPRLDGRRRPARFGRPVGHLIAQGPAAGASRAGRRPDSTMMGPSRSALDRRAPWP